MRIRRSLPTGLSLAEVVVSTLLVGILMVAALRSVAGTAASINAIAEQGDGRDLARQLLEEILTLTYEDPNQQPSFGAESGELIFLPARTGLDDIDDFCDWTESPPKWPDGSTIAGFSGWTRTADVVKLAPDTHTPLSDNSVDSGSRLVIVTAVAPNGKTFLAQALQTKLGCAYEPLGCSQTVVTWVGVRFESGTSGILSSGTSIQNRAADR